MDNLQQEQQNNKLKINNILAAVIALLLITNIASAYFLFAVKKADNDSVGNKEQKTADKVIDNGEGDQSSPTDYSIDNNAGGALEEESADMENKNLTESEIIVEWNEMPIITTSYWPVFDYDTARDKIESYNKKNNENTNADEYLKKFNIYKSGRVKQGIYAGKDLYILTFTPEWPSEDMLFRVIKNDNELIFLAKHSDEPWGPDAEIFTVNDKITIANLETEDEIQIPNSKLKLVKAEKEPLILFQTLDNIKKLFKYNGEDYVYKENNGDCFLAKAKDGTVRYYYLSLDFLGEREGNGMIAIIPNVLKIDWNNGKKNQDEYTSQKAGCGGWFSCYNYAGYITGHEQLKETGTTANGDKIYELKDNDFTLEGESESVLRSMYDIYYYPEAGNKTAFEEFLSYHPIIYWQDPFGDYMELRNAKFQPMAECGKPVIYLYPEKEIDVSVKVNPTGGFSMTEPAYGNGWRVKAEPNGRLYNYQDQKFYPYLFWEGRGLDYHRPSEGFVAARENVKKFLEEKLERLGLVKKEYDEFIEFWLPKMQEKKYYFITFIPKEEFDKLAPLNISPKPDTVIRVFMDYEGLDEYVKVKEQKIITPQRNGFTVVEWGGVLHK
ncbi:hypothetical protein L6249_00625 [Candidatus Parcubacteria bacterium]|nr:hypothetical protein [Candidatus Parcubacteria bacterium]